MNTASLPGWLQVVLVLLCGVVGWMLLRPYRRITQLGGKDPLAAIAAGGLFANRQARQAQEAADAAAASREAGRVPGVPGDRAPMRVELRADPGSEGSAGHDGLPSPGTPDPAGPHRDTDDGGGSTRRVPERSGEGWREPAEVGAGYALYQPGRSPVTSAAPSSRPGRVEAGAEH
jgi:hypothetical protein